MQKRNKMPYIRVINKNIPGNSKNIEYEFGDESLKSIIHKYDSNASKSNSCLAIGENIIKDWNVPIDACLFYGESIYFFSHELNLNIHYWDKKIQIKMDHKNSIKDLKSKLFYIFRQDLTLRFRQVILSDDSRRLVGYGIINDSDIYIQEDNIEELSRNLKANIRVLDITNLHEILR